jgi:hypothetical protein
MLKSVKQNIVFFLSLMFAACGTTQNQPQKPMETYQTTATIPPSVSTVNIPVRISVSQMQRLLNNKMNGVIYEDNNLEDDGLMMKATKIQPITMWLDGFQMGYRVPLKLWVFKKILGNRGIEAEGEIALAFKTTINIGSDWSIEPKTELIGYEWIKNMAVKTGLGGIDVKYIANMVIERSKTSLTSSIDNQLKTQFQIRKNLEESWALMQKPVPISSSYGTWWVKMTPQTVSMTPFRAISNDIIESVISATSLAEVIAGEQQPAFRPNSYLPNFALGMGNANDFIVNLTTDISFKEAEALAKNFVKGQKFNPGGKEIEVTDIQLFGQNDKIVVNTTFKGSYSGSLYLVGRPVFNAMKNTIELEDLDYDLQSKSFLLKSAKWLFDKKILSKMKEACIFPLDDNVKFFKTMMNDQLQNYKFNNNVTLKGAVEDIKVDKIALVEGNIKIFVSSKGKLTLDVDGLDNF